jgi:hypothetical protein
MFDRSTAVIAMDAVFFILFGMVAGLFLLPRLQRLADQVRRRLDELDQLDRTRGPSPWSKAGGGPGGEAKRPD